MKSIMEEASSIFKAIEKAWLRAEKPQSFSVKVLEEQTKNFIGMTVKPAKVALLFEEPVENEAKEILKQSSRNQSQPLQSKRLQHEPSARQPRERINSSRDNSSNNNRSEQREQRIDRRNEQRTQVRPRPVNNQESVTSPSAQTEEHNTPRSRDTSWDAAVVQDVVTWLNGTLTHLFHNPPAITHTVEAEQLVITFDRHLTPDSSQERLLLSSLAHLLMQAMRHQQKEKARGLRVLLKIA